MSSTSSPLPSALSGALRALADAQRRVPLVVPAAPEPGSVEAVRAWLAIARPVVQSAVKHAKLEEAGLQARIAAPANAKDDEAAWRALDAACAQVERELLSPPSLQARLTEGRRSMMPRVEKVISEHLRTSIEGTGGKLRASVDAAGIAHLQAELPRWVSAWSEYSFAWIEHDLSRTLHVLWTARGPALPVPAPTFAPLRPVAVDKAIELPAIDLERDEAGLGAGALRHGRAVLYSVLGLLGLFGVSRSGGGEGIDPTHLKIAMALMAIAAGGFGYMQARIEREKERERLRDQARQKADQATRDVLRVWLDRSADKLAAAANEQLLARRDAFVAWHRATVAPAEQRRAEALRRLTADAEAARAAQGGARDALRDLERALKALDDLLAHLV